MPADTPKRLRSVRLPGFLSPRAEAPAGGADEPSRVLSSGLTEAGVTWADRKVSSGTVLDRVRRAWAALWGWDGTNLRLCTVDRHGQQIVRPPRWEEGVTYGQAGVLNGAGEIEYAIGAQVDWVQVIVEWPWLAVFFSHDGTVWTHDRVGVGVSSVAAGDHSCLSEYIRCRHVRIAVPPAGGVDYRIIAERLPNLER